MKVPPISKLEELLDSEPEGSIEILPNGTIRQREIPPEERKAKLLTQAKNLGSTY